MIIDFKIWRVERECVCVFFGDCYVVKYIVKYGDDGFLILEFIGCEDFYFFIQVSVDVCFIDNIFCWYNFGDIIVFFCVQGVCFDVIICFFFFVDFLNIVIFVENMFNGFFVEVCEKFGNNFVFWVLIVGVFDWLFVMMKFDFNFVVVEFVVDDFVLEDK